MLAIPTQGLLTPQGFRQVGVTPALCDAVAESKRVFQTIGTYLGLIEIAHNDILVAKYIPEKLGNLVMSSETKNEQRWQNKCGLVLKYGPMAKEDGFKYDAGDWVFYRTSDGEEIDVKCENDAMMAHCLYLSPAHIVGRVLNPDVIW